MLQLGFQLFERLVPRRGGAKPPAEETVLPWRHGILVRIVRRPRARRYLLRLEPDGSARLVIPRRGNRAEAMRFLERSEAWLLERQRRWRIQTAARPRAWRDGARFLYRGEETLLHVEESDARARLHFGDQEFSASRHGDYREVVTAHLRRLAEKELPSRTLELAREHGVAVARVTVRAQRTRWGSCSARGTISLNWRLVQAPPLVRDYLIVHELMHRREMNHSSRYWKHVATAFPEYRTAEAWLKKTRLESL